MYQTNLQVFEHITCTSLRTKILLQFENIHPVYYHRKNPMANNSTALNISLLLCDFTMNNSDCSYLFKEVHVSATIFQALFAIVILTISVPINLILIASMVTYHDDLDNSMVLSISFLVANIIVSVFSQWRNIFHIINPGLVDWLLGLQCGYFHYNQWFVCSLVHCFIHIIRQVLSNILCFDLP